MGTTWGFPGLLMPKIAISYRRTDSDATGRLFDRLVLRYGEDSVFRDIDNIPFGIDFRKVINDALRDTDVLIAIVGPNWRGADERGGARINEANDLVRIEVETALQRDIPVIPVLVGGAAMPKGTELPDSLVDFSFRNAASIDSGRNFDTDVQRLLRSMDRLLDPKMGRSNVVEASRLNHPGSEQAQPPCTPAATQASHEASALSRPEIKAEARNGDENAQAALAQSSPTTIGASLPTPPSSVGPQTGRLLALQAVARIGVALFLLTLVPSGFNFGIVVAIMWLMLGAVTIAIASRRLRATHWTRVVGLTICGFGAVLDALTTIVGIMVFIVERNPPVSEKLFGQLLVIGSPLFLIVYIVSFVYFKRSHRLLQATS
jgi:hypothetical protein